MDYETYRHEINKDYIATRYVRLTWQGKGFWGFPKTIKRTYILLRRKPTRPALFEYEHDWFLDREDRVNNRPRLQCIMSSKSEDICLLRLRMRREIEKDKRKGFVFVSETIVSQTSPARQSVKSNPVPVISEPVPTTPEVAIPVVNTFSDSCRRAKCIDNAGHEAVLSVGERYVVSPDPSDKGLLVVRLDGGRSEVFLRERFERFVLA